MPATHPLTRFTRWAWVVFCLLTVGYIYIYQWMPLPEDWNDAFLNFSIALAAAAAAATSTLIWMHFGRQEGLRGIWRPFAWGLWLWAVAEFSWATWALFDEVPGLSPIDIPWVVAFVPLGLALFRQFRLVYSPTAQQERRWLLIAWGGVAGGTMLTTLVLHLLGETEQAWYETLLLVFYPYADLALAISAILLARAFGRGLWGRAWIGLLVMSVSDAIYSVLEFSGIYAASAGEGNILSLLADVSYFDSYLLLALFCIAQLVLLRHGPPPARSRALPGRMAPNEKKPA